MAKRAEAGFFEATVCVVNIGLPRGYMFQPFRPAQGITVAPPSAASSVAPLALEQIFNEASALTLHPWKTGGFPTGDLSSVAVAVQGSLEPLRHITASREARRRHCLGRHPAAAAGPAQKK